MGSVGRERGVALELANGDRAAAPLDADVVPTVRLMAFPGSAKIPSRTFESYPRIW